MKYLFLLLIVLAGCTDSKYSYREKVCTSDLKNCQLVYSENLRFFHDKCMELAKCMRAQGEVVHFNNQPHNPYACSITKKGKTRSKGQYLYPTASLSFGRADLSFENELTVCEIMTETGRHSDEEYRKVDQVFEAMAKRRQQRKEPTPPPPMKIREHNG